MAGLHRVRSRATEAPSRLRLRGFRAGQDARQVRESVRSFGKPVCRFLQALRNARDTRRGGPGGYRAL